MAVGCPAGCRSRACGSSASARLLAWRGDGCAWQAVGGSDRSLTVHRNGLIAPVVSCGVFECGASEGGSSTPGHV